MLIDKLGFHAQKRETDFLRFIAFIFFQPKLDLSDPFAKDPIRLPIFQVNSSKPYNAEPPLAVITDSFITPNDLFYVRNHLPVPDIDPNSFRY